MSTCAHERFMSMLMKPSQGHKMHMGGCPPKNSYVVKLTVAEDAVVVDTGSVDLDKLVL